MSGAFDWLAVGDVGEARNATGHLGIGGSAGRLVVEASRLGASAAIVGKVGEDEAGQRVRDILSGAKVDVQWLQIAAKMRTTLWIDPDGEHRRVDRGADLSLRLDELPPRSVQALLTVVSGSMLAVEPARSAAIGALSDAATRGGRSALLLEAELLWSTNARMTRKVLEPALLAAGSVALTSSDARVLFGPVSSRQAVRMLGQLGPRIVYLAEENGAVVLRDGSRVHELPAPRAGASFSDRLARPAAFWAALAHRVPALKAAEQSLQYGRGFSVRSEKNRAL
jgi:sugar/nucleoside kinase (ribokinase family)